MNRHFLLLCILSFLLLPVSSVEGQNVDPRNVDVKSLSDDQILRLIKEIEKRGLSENEAIALAQARGMSQTQISALRSRMNELKMSGTSSLGNAGKNDYAQGQYEQELSVKAEVDPAKVDERIFGFTFFNNENLSFEPNVNIPVSESYVLGAGDEVLIDVWGASQQSYQQIIDRNGNINIPNIGPVPVGGLTQKQATKRIFNKLTLIYRDLVSEQPRTFANVHIGTVKAIKVNVIGEVFTPGTYTLPGTATAFNALYLAGGPNKAGSFRNIKVIRDGDIVATLDVYDFLINGNGKVNVPLRDADVIMVPTYENRVKVGGAFKRDGLFEAKKGEKVADLIKYAGGFNENAYSKRIELYRITDRQRAFKDVASEAYVSVELANGDSIYAGPILERYENKVSVEGAVYRPGNYELTEGLTLSELLENAEGVREDVFLNRGLITRLNKDLSLKNISFNVADVLNGKADFELQREDMVTISSINDLREVQTVEIFGEVQYGGEFDYQDDMTLSDLVMKAGGFKESASEAFIEISRRLSHEETQKVGDKIAHVYQFSISRDLKMNGEDARFTLQPFDQVFVRQSPGFEDRKVVKILGEVNYAGDYSLTNKKERLSDMIRRAGGLSPDAFPEGAMLTRKVNVTQKEKRLREELLKKDSTLTFTNIGFDVVGINLKEILNNPGSKSDLFLHDGDELIIPKEIQTVKVSGEVLNPLAASYVPRKSLKHYIDQSGGFGLDAKKGKVYVIYPNGAAASTKRFLFFRNYPKVIPGSEVVVPQKPQRNPIPATAWISMASALASLSLTVVTIVNQTK